MLTFTQITWNTLLTPNGVRRESLGGRTFLVAPITLIVPGVLNGSQGPLYYPPDEVVKNYKAWEGAPLTLNHPYDPLTNELLPANATGVKERQWIGSVRNPTVTSGKLQAEGWFDEERIKQKDSRIHNALLAGHTIEVSTGLYTDNTPAGAGAAHNGKAYTQVAQNYRPDHLAVLPDQQGACSISDGCGVLVNTERISVVRVSPGTSWNTVPVTYSPLQWGPLWVPVHVGVPLANAALVNNPQGAWQAPQGRYSAPLAGDAPAEVKAILKKVYSAWRDQHGGEQPATKARGAKIAWGAVRKAGWYKGADGKWHKKATANATANILGSDVNTSAPALQARFDEFLNGAPLFPELLEQLTANELSYDDFAGLVYQAFRMAHPIQYCPDTGEREPTSYLVATFDGYVVYEEADQLYRQSYTVTDEAEISFVEDAQPVRREVEYVPVKNMLDPTEQDEEYGDTEDEGHMAHNGTVLGGLKEDVTWMPLFNTTGLKASDYAYVPDPSKPSTWKLRIDDARHVAGAAAALGKGFRGNKVSIPGNARDKVKARVRAAWKRFNKGKSADQMPTSLK